MTIRAPFPWAGGKSRAAHLIWQALGDVDSYVEPFAGSLAVLLGRPAQHLRRPRVETVNDLDCYLANFWRAVAVDPEAVAAHADWPVNEADLSARHQWLVDRADFRERMKTDPEFFDAKIAGLWAWGVNLWIGSQWCASANPTRQLPAIGTLHLALRERLGRQGLEALSARLRPVRVACGDWTRVLGESVMFPSRKSGGGRPGGWTCGVVLDPPYRPTDRNQQYANDTDCADAVVGWACEHGDDPAFRIALCGYEGHYSMPESWTCVPWKAKGGFGSQRKDGVNVNAGRERIWLSPACAGVPLQLGLLSEGA